jgi:type 1 glutamine amidotransferase
VFYFMAGHSAKDFQNPTYAAIVRNALSVPVSRLITPR